MVVKMMRWGSMSSSTTAAVATRKFQVKIRPLKIEGVDYDNQAKVIAVKVKWKGDHPKFGLVPLFHKKKKDTTSRRIAKKGQGSVEWDNDGDEFENVCYFTHAFPWEVSFNVLYSSSLDVNSTGNMVVIGKAVVNVAEIASRMVAEVEEKLPLTLHIGSLSIPATLHVKMKFTEIRGFEDSASRVGDTLKSEESSTETSSVIESVKKGGWFSWKRRRLSLRPARINKTLSFAVDSQNLVKPEPCTESKDQNEDISKTCGWEVKELQSRDTQTRLKANVFFASFDQCSDKAAGESACTALVAVIAHWLQSNRDATPTRSEFDNLIQQGSSEWRKLCQHDTYINSFPNKHFDLETILGAGIRPIAISHDQSFVGFFSPDKFEALQGVMSFDQIWDKISTIAQGIESEPRVYIISWNDHFFVLKVEANAYYIIDTLGERLFEGCNKAYILKFDDNTTMSQEKVAEDKSQEKTDIKAEREMIICKGKECCRKFIKRFLAAIPLKELEEKEEKETVSYFSLHQRLQIEFNFSYLLSSSSSSLTSSPFSSSATSTPSYL